jgi:bifunctional ADP-heptose synthase (sugar kinase/adenylyltransferase)
VRPRAIADKLLAADAVDARLREWSAARETVAVVRGVFDVPHAAHARLLARTRAEERATRLLVAVLDDRAAAAQRSMPPILDASHRATVVAALGVVDGVTVVADPAWTPPVTEGVSPMVRSEPELERPVVERVLDRYAQR